MKATKISLSLSQIESVHLFCFFAFFATSYRYETRNYDKIIETDKKPLDKSFNEMSLNTDGGNLSLIDQGSQRLTSMTQRVMERKSYTTTSETRTEKKTESHSFRME